HLVGLGDTPRHIDGPQDTMGDVVVPGQLGLPGTGVAPGHEEDRVALCDRVRDEGVLRLKVENVVLVNAGWHDDEGALVYAVGGRGVLDQLNQLVLVDHAARRGADVAAHLEGRFVGHRDPAPRQVFGEQTQALGHTGAAGFHREL